MSPEELDTEADPLIGERAALLTESQPPTSWLQIVFPFCPSVLALKPPGD